MTTYNVIAKQWEQGWELHIEKEGVTQVRTLNKAKQQVRDYLETMHETSFDDAVINIRTELGNNLETEAMQARAATRRAEQDQRTAAERSRKIARKLRKRGISVTDTATILGVSRGRISQLTKV